MKIGIDALNLRNDRRGMGRVVRAVLRTAVASGIDVTLLSKEPGPWADDPIAEILAGVRFAKPSSASRRSLYDVVWYPWNGIRFSAAVPTLAHIHDTFGLHERHANWIARRRVRGPLWRAALNASLIATDSIWSRTCIERELGVKGTEIVVIPLAPDPFFFPDPNDGANAPERPYVLMVGAGEPRKNARFLVSAFAEAFPDRDVRLVAVGSLSDDAVAEAASRGVVLVREDASDERLRSLYRHASCVAVPSLGEGFGLVVVEAQACAAPVVASNAAAVPEAAGDAAILLAPDDRAGWRDALREVVRDEARAAQLRASSIARWGFTARDGPSRAILDTLRDLAQAQD